MINQISTCVKGMYPEILSTLEYMTGIDRGSKYIKGLTSLANYLEKRLQNLGCVIKRYEDDTYGPTLVGIKKGSGKATILLYAHMDTVWPEGTVEKRGFSIEGDRAYGPGVSDCSHGIIGSLYALKALNTVGFDGYKELIILFNPDEELYSPHSDKYIAEYARNADIAFCMESSDKADEYISARGGVMFYDIEVHGLKSHAGGMPEVGRNAIEELAYKISLVHSLHIKDAYLHTTLINGGVSEGMVPDYAWAHVDARVDTMQAYQDVEKAFREIEKSTCIEGTTTVCHHRPGGCLPMPRCVEQDKFCKLVDQVSQELNYPIHEAFCGGGANTVISANAGAPTLDGVVPTSGRWHTDQEYLELNTIVPRISILAEVLRRISIDEKYLKNRC